MLTASRQVDMANILVVDDYRDAAESLARWLRQFGHEVHIAHDGVEAMEIARCQEPHYVLLDLGLPRLDGYEVASRLRQEQTGPLVIIAITGYCQESDRQQALEVGCDHFFVKPVDPRTLISLISGSSPTPDTSVQNRQPPEAMPPTMRVAGRDVHITNALGLHLRAACKFANLAQEFQASVAVTSRWPRSEWKEHPRLGDARSRVRLARGAKCRRARRGRSSRRPHRPYRASIR